PAPQRPRRAGEGRHSHFGMNVPGRPSSVDLTVSAMSMLSSLAAFLPSRTLSAWARGLPVDSSSEQRTRSGFLVSFAQATQSEPSPEYMQSKHQTSLMRLA